MRSIVALRLGLAAVCWQGADRTALAEVAGGRLEIVWPTPNTAFIEGRPRADFLQATASGDPASGGFGGVRDSGERFHEGIDLKPVARDQKGEPADKIFAVLPGIVRHVSDRPGESNYGRYIVLEHPGTEPAIYTLYAHLRSIAPGVGPGAAVARGQFIAVMGRSEGGSGIPKERAHLHFEMGLRVTDDFERWYGQQKYGSPNEHGLWNGYNLMGFDPLDFLDRFRAHTVNNFTDYFAQLKPVVRVRVATRQIPDFTRRYPSLVTSAPDDGGRVAPAVGLPAGWDIACNATGLPFRWTPLTAADVLGYAPNEVRIVETDVAALATEHGKTLVVKRAGHAVPGKDLQMVLQQLFGF
ncbi:MAG: M23 family metallopeptidase [Verrucomicrobiota bacterium]